MGFWKWLVVLLIIAALGAGVYDLIRTNSALGGKTTELSDEVRRIEEENKKLASQIEYLKNPHNLLKEIKANFNYREVDEELIIIVPRD
jgi:uncharacterized protein YlxW (UPF0749 family)